MKFLKLILEIHKFIVYIIIHIVYRGTSPNINKFNFNLVVQVEHNNTNTVVNIGKLSLKVVQGQASEVDGLVLLAIADC